MPNISYCLHIVKKQHKLLYYGSFPGNWYLEIATAVFLSAQEEREKRKSKNILFNVGISFLNTHCYLEPFSPVAYVSYVAYVANRSSSYTVYTFEVAVAKSSSRKRE